jgi:N-acetylmuramoyl-L-alanine amidase
MIFISAGHHPSAPGATFERFIENDEAVIWAQIMADELGSDAILVPNAVLRHKVDFINSRALDGDVAIEIHFNSAMQDGEHVGRGSETLYYPNSVEGERLAESIQEFLSVVFPPNRGAKVGWYHMDPERGPDFFLAKTKCTALIIEPEFVHRSNKIHAFRDEAIAAIIDGLNQKG